MKLQVWWRRRRCCCCLLHWRRPRRKEVGAAAGRRPCGCWATRTRTRATWATSGGRSRTPGTTPTAPPSPANPPAASPTAESSPTSSVNTPALPFFFVLLLRLINQWRPLMGWIHAFAVGRGSIAISLRINGARPPPSLFGRSANQFPFLLQPAATGRRPVQLASTASAWQSARVQLQRQQCMVGRVARIICDGSTAAGCRRSFSADSRRKVFFFFLDTQYAYYTSVHSKCLLHVFPSRNASKQ
jgi:hypothetical protein